MSQKPPPKQFVKTPINGTKFTLLVSSAKGGVGKSTLATLTSLSLASRFSDSSVALLDLDKQATSSKALRKFENSRLSVVGSHEFMLESGMPNNSYLASYMSDISSYIKVENSSLDN